MHILFLTHYFPPEVNAPASRTYEHARFFIAEGHRVTIITCAPNHPQGILYSEYKNRWFQWEKMDGIEILRVKTYLSPNQRVVRRISNYLSFMGSAILFSFLVRRPDVVVSTSPQFFCGMAGFFVSALKRRPWILEIRDLWPDSIIAVGAIRNKWIIKWLRYMERFLYRKATRIIALTHAFKEHIGKMGIDPKKISIITNGADLSRYFPTPKENSFREKMSLRDKFVVTYAGTLGMAHGLATVLKTARSLANQTEIVFLLVGDGAEREELIRKKNQDGLNNLLILPQQPKERMPEILSASDACLVLLKDTPLFRTVIPSKIFEAMAVSRPIILGVLGESEKIIREGKAGICIPPEDSQALAEAVLKLHKLPKTAKTLGENGLELVRSSYDRTHLARDFLEVLSETADRSRT